jgi:tRNA dimethylallyltransferase
MSQAEAIPLVVIVGPTAVGKSALALELALKFGLEIINADSMQVYRGMDIGSAKPSPAERNLVPHHLIDIRNPDEDYSAARFLEEARRTISELAECGRRALVVGGTGLYIQSLLQGLFPAPPADKQLRERLRTLESEQGKWHLHQQLAEVDPEAASRIHPNDTFRVIRALEVFRLTGTAISEHQRRHRFSDAAFAALKIGLTRDRGEIYRRIEARVDSMIAAGLEEEVRQLLVKGYAPTIKAFQSLGYQQMLSYIQGAITLDEAIRLIKTNTKRYAKRQLTWFRKDPEIQWFALPEQTAAVEELLRKFLNI